MRVPEDRVVPGPWPDDRVRPAQPVHADSGAPAARAETAQSARTSRRTTDPAALVSLAASMVPPRPPAWQRILGQIQHFWLLVVVALVWQAVSVFGQDSNPQLDGVLPPLPGSRSSLHAVRAIIAQSVAARAIEEKVEVIMGTRVQKEHPRRGPG